MRVAVTGGTGFLGRWLLLRLVARGAAVRALHRSSLPAWASKLPGVEWIEGALPGPLPPEFPGPGVDLVLHLAALYAEGEESRNALEQANVEGTRRLLDACARDTVTRVLHCSTMGTCAPRADGKPATEADAPAVSRLSPYAATKLEAERIALAERRIPVVVANPAAPVGAWDARPTVTGARIRDAVAGRFPRLLAGPVNHVSARAVADGLLLVGERGRPGERYLLGGENLGPDEFLARLATAAGTAPPSRTWMQRLRGQRRPSFGQLAIDDARARSELGYQPGDLDQALREAAAWFERGADPAP